MSHITEAIIHLAQEKRCLLSKEAQTRRRRDRHPTTDYGDLLRKDTMIGQQLWRLNSQKLKKKRTSEDIQTTCQDKESENKEPLKKKVKMDPLNEKNEPKGAEPTIPNWNGWLEAIRVNMRRLFLD